MLPFVTVLATVRLFCLILVKTHSQLCLYFAEFIFVGLIKAEKMTLQLVDFSFKYKGTYYLTYQLFPTQSQIRQAYPLLDDFSILNDNMIAKNY